MAFVPSLPSLLSLYDTCPLKGLQAWFLHRIHRIRVYAGSTQLARCVEPGQMSIYLTMYPDTWYPSSGLTTVKLVYFTDYRRGMQTPGLIRLDRGSKVLQGVTTLYLIRLDMCNKTLARRDHTLPH